MRAALVGLVVLLAAGPAAAYPIDAWKDTGIARLEAFRLAQEGEVQGIVLYWGAQLYTPEIQLRLSARPPFKPPAPDADFTQKLVEVLGDDADGYGIAVIDISDPDAPLYAAHQPDRLQNPGSVGKIMVGLAWFQALADIYPDDVAARRKILRETIITHMGEDAWDGRVERMLMRFEEDGITIGARVRHNSGASIVSARARLMLDEQGDLYARIGSIRIGTTPIPSWVVSLLGQGDVRPGRMRLGPGALELGDGRVARLVAIRTRDQWVDVAVETVSQSQ